MYVTNLRYPEYTDVMTARFPFPLHLTLVEDASSVSARQSGLGIPEVWTLSCCSVISAETCLMVAQSSRNDRHEGTDARLVMTRWSMQGSVVFRIRRG